MPKEVIGFKALVKLNCHHNSIRWLPEELNLLLNLKEIDMRCGGGGGREGGRGGSHDMVMTRCSSRNLGTLVH